MSRPDELAELQRERDFYLRLLQLGEHQDLQGLLREALSLVVELTSARTGYLELSEPDAENGASSWWIAHGCSGEEVERIRGSISRGVIAAALASVKTINTVSALTDVRFAGRASVQKHKIDAVICAPVGTPAQGVLYLQGRQTIGPFSKADQAGIEMFARHLAPQVERLVARTDRRAAQDPTRTWRSKLEVKGLVGRSQALADLFKQLHGVSSVGVDVLLTGPTGSGKTAVARAVHDNSDRRKGPFVALNCGAIPENLFESELFGAERGAFTGADRRIEGKVQAAQGGTLFLDEVGELPLGSQTKLLQFLESRTYFTLGRSTRSTADLRVVAATNRDLEEAVEQGTLRQDLFYRLGFHIQVPGLDERREDIGVLCKALWERACTQYKLPRLPLTPAALRAAAGAPWPGNVRQLARAVRDAVVMAHAENAPGVSPRHLLGRRAGADAQQDAPTTFVEATHHFQRQLLIRTLAECNGTVSRAARELGLARSYVYTLMDQHDLRG